MLGHMVSLSVRDRESFLAEPHVAALSVSAGSGHGPFTVPIWYQYTPGGEAWVHTEAGSRKARLIATAGRFTLMVERVMPTVRYVSVEGPVTRAVLVVRRVLLGHRAAAGDRCALSAAAQGPGLHRVRHGRTGRAGRNLPAPGAMADGRSRARSRTTARRPRMMVWW